MQAARVEVFRDTTRAMERLKNGQMGLLLFLCDLPHLELEFFHHTLPVACPSKNTFSVTCSAGDWCLCSRIIQAACGTKQGAPWDRTIDLDQRGHLA